MAVDTPPSSWKQATNNEEATALGQAGLSFFQPPDALGPLLGGTGRAKMVWESLRKGIHPCSENGVDSVKAKAILENCFEGIPTVAQQTIANCGTIKLLLQLKDGLQVETVLIPHDGRPTAAGIVEPRSTLCVSSQVGCNRACDFCATGKMGFVRQLTSHEILSQVFLALGLVRDRNLPPLHNVVFMGMGEPLNNLAAVAAATSVLTDQRCFALARQRVTVSTVGPSPAAIRAAAALPAMLAWSVHAADDAVRRALVPTTRHKMEELRDEFLHVLLSRSRGASTFMVAATLIRGVNDSPEHALELVRLLRPMVDAGIKICVDLIPYNSIGVGGYDRADREAVTAFQRLLRDQGMVCFVRVTRGDDGAAACGQLATAARLPRAAAPAAASGG